MNPVAFDGEGEFRRNANAVRRSEGALLPLRPEGYKGQQAASSLEVDVRITGDYNTDAEGWPGVIVVKNLKRDSSGDPEWIDGNPVMVFDLNGDTLIKDKRYTGRVYAVRTWVGSGSGSGSGSFGSGSGSGSGSNPVNKSVYVRVSSNPVVDCCHPSKPKATGYEFCFARGSGSASGSGSGTSIPIPASGLVITVDLCGYGGDPWADFFNDQIGFSGLVGFTGTTAYITTKDEYDFFMDGSEDPMKWCCAGPAQWQGDPPWGQQILDWDDFGADFLSKLYQAGATGDQVKVLYCCSTDADGPACIKGFDCQDGNCVPHRDEDTPADYPNLGACLAKPCNAIVSIPQKGKQCIYVEGGTGSFAGFSYSTTDAIYNGTGWPFGFTEPTSPGRSISGQVTLCADRGGFYFAGGVSVPASGLYCECQASWPACADDDARIPVTQELVDYNPTAGSGLIKLTTPCGTLNVRVGCSPPPPPGAYSCIGTTTANKRCAPNPAGEFATLADCEASPCAAPVNCFACVLLGESGTLVIPDGPYAGTWPAAGPWATGGSDIQATVPVPGIPGLGFLIDCTSDDGDVTVSGFGTETAKSVSCGTPSVITFPGAPFGATGDVTFTT